LKDKKLENLEKSERIKNMKQPNIILFVVDQMRGDCIGAAGHPDVKTPYLDSLAAWTILDPQKKR
jgi:arylsulfatase A-like enzyme